MKLDFWRHGARCARGDHLSRRRLPVVISAGPSGHLIPRVLSSGMAIRDRVMNALVEARRKAGETVGDADYEPSAFTEKDRLNFAFDGIKLIGTGNGAGALASVIGLYYFKDRTDLQFAMKLAAIAFFVGLLIHAITLVSFVTGLNNAAAFIDRMAKEKDVTKIPTKAFNAGMDSMVRLIVSFVTAMVGLLCFVVGVGLGLYAVIKL